MAAPPPKAIDIYLTGDQGRFRCEVNLPLDIREHLPRFCTGCRQPFAIQAQGLEAVELTCPRCGAQGEVMDFNTGAQERYIAARMDQEHHDIALAKADSAAERYALGRRPRAEVPPRPEPLSFGYACTHCEGREFSLEGLARRCPFCGQAKHLERLAPLEPSRFKSGGARWWVWAFVAAMVLWAIATNGPEP